MGNMRYYFFIIKYNLQGVCVCGDRTIPIVCQSACNDSCVSIQCAIFDFH